MLAAAKGYRIEIFRVADGALLQTLVGHTFNVLGLAWSPNGKLLASASGDKTAKIWRVVNGAVLLTLTGHTSLVDDRRVSRPTARPWRRAATTCTVKLWTVATGALQRSLTGHTDLVASVATGRGGFLASGSWDGTIRLWNPTSGALIRYARGSERGERPDGLDHGQWTHDLRRRPRQSYAQVARERRHAAR